MTRFFQPKNFSITGLVAIMLIACNSYPQSLKRPNMTELSPRLQEIFTNSKTVCFGQFIMDAPATATLVYGLVSVEAPIRYYPGERNLIDTHIKDQLMEIEKDRKFLREEDVAKFPLFGKILDGAVPGQKLVFGSLERVSYSIYSFVPVGDDLYVQTWDTAMSKDEAIAESNRVAKNLRLRDFNEIPTEIGTCIEGGFVGFRPKYERMSLGIRLREFPDVHFSIQVVKNQDYIPEASDLESRLKSAEKDGGNWYSRVKFFRRASRQIGNWQGAEALALKPAQEKEKESHEFHFISMGAPNDSLQPELDLQLDTGASGRRKGAVKPSLTDEEAVALWDKLTSSIRVRPTGGKPEGKPAHPSTPSETRAITGELCPKTGWWECPDAGNVEGGKRRYFSEGEPLPYVVVAAYPNLWQKLTGDHPSRKTTTVWKLVQEKTDNSL